VKENPFHDFAEWWPVGDYFATFMAKAIHGEWLALVQNSGDLGPVELYTSFYLKTVYDREPDAALVSNFVNLSLPHPLGSGEFDAISYAFYRSAFDHIGSRLEAYENSLEVERRLFTKRVGKRFFDQVADQLALDLPAGLASAADFEQLQREIGKVGQFLSDQGYLRDHFAFHFDVETTHAGREIAQSADQFLGNLQNGGTGYAFYEMGYPIILPSAVYLYHTLGEAQHHSSRTIEELFDRIGFVARETDDFDPIGYPADMVVELWEIRGR
ncbi:MAG: hypothetical protein AAF633_16850, partial [Chloroflexota bacterium]